MLQIALIGLYETNLENKNHVIAVRMRQSNWLKLTKK
jgi:hypothetical protein